MSDDRVACPNCGQTYSSQAAVPGYPFECVKCEQEFVPGGGEVEPPAAPSSTYDPEAMDGGDSGSSVAPPAPVSAPPVEPAAPYNPEAPAEAPGSEGSPVTQPLSDAHDTSMRTKAGPVESNPFTPGGTGEINFSGVPVEHKSGKGVLIFGILFLILAGGGIGLWKSGVFAPYSEKILNARVPHSTATPKLDGVRIVNLQLGYEFRVPSGDWTALMEGAKLDSVKAQLEIKCNTFPVYMGIWASKQTVDMETLKANPSALKLSKFELPWEGSGSGANTSAPEEIDVNGRPAISVAFDVHHRQKGARVPMEGRLIVIPGTSHTYIIAIYAVKGELTYAEEDIKKFLAEARIKG